jgi:pimeloyl-ACP methyl ester carboxylesterase
MMKSMFDPAAAGPGMPRLRPAAATLIALHCSGASGDMWQPLRDRMGVGSRMLAPDLHGARNGPAWHGNRAFTLEDEAAPVVALIDAERRPVHLVGHSYGGAVALQVALARPAAVAGITLYEPSAFHLLGADDGAARAEIVDLAAEVGARLGRGDARGAMARFVTYWGGRDSWDGLRPDIQAALMRWAPKVTLDFHSLLDRPHQPRLYAQLDVPCLILSGDQSPAPARATARTLAALMPDCRIETVKGAGHMGPLTHKSLVADAVIRHAGGVSHHPSRPSPHSIREPANEFNAG